MVRKKPVNKKNRTRFLNCLNKMCPIILILKIADIMLNFAIKKPYNRTIIVHFCKASHPTPLYGYNSLPELN